ncbi:hypothetical protein Y695_00392 [Hydrogenophaga sp. T4]|nr:hypothetical protein Y695_00392 [Hydrogenophaga sp. T4]
MGQLHDMAIKTIQHTAMCHHHNPLARMLGCELLEALEITLKALLRAFATRNCIGNTFIMVPGINLWIGRFCFVARLALEYPVVTLPQSGVEAYAVSRTHGDAAGSIVGTTKIAADQKIERLMLKPFSEQFSLGKTLRA